MISTYEIKRDQTTEAEINELDKLINCIDDREAAASTIENNIRNYDIRSARLIRYTSVLVSALSAGVLLYKFITSQSNSSVVSHPTNSSAINSRLNTIDSRLESIDDRIGNIPSQSSETIFSFTIGSET